jgi:adenylate cyclase
VNIRPPKGFAPLSIGIIALALLVVAPNGPLAIVHEQAFDLLLGFSPAKRSTQTPLVVDIDRPSLAALGQWPWKREQLAELITAIASAKPRVLGLDILIEGPDERSPAALARRLAEVAGETPLHDLMQALPDGDVLLAAALKGVPTVMAVALDPDRSGNSPPSSTFLVRGMPDVSAFWHAEGAIGPTAGVASGAAGLGVVALPGDSDAHVRRVPLLAVTGDSLWPGLALEMARVASEASAYLLTGHPTALRVGELVLPLPRDATLRLRPISERAHGARTLRALDVLRDPATRAQLGKRLVFLGSSAPELGGLRPAATGDLVPSVQIQADALQQILAGDMPSRPPYVVIFELVCALAMGAFAGRLALTMAPLNAGLGTLYLAGAWVLFSLWALYFGHVLVSPITIPIVAFASYATAALVVASQIRRREAAIRRRFEQHVAPQVVRRIIEQPELLKVEGEMREVTALCTDVEGFTPMTARAEPRALVRLLDRYFEGLAQLVVDHGGMVDKIVGDGLLALFNAPLDLAEHPARAVQCARAILAFSQTLRETPDATALGFGRTRIGIETGSVIVGDVGGGRRLDYTAYGAAMNLAARLEKANKELGTMICVGPTAAGHLPPEVLRPLGALSVAGVTSPIRVFEPWPDRLDAAGRRQYEEAAAMVDKDPAAAAQALREFSINHPGDLAAELFGKRLSRGGKLHALHR